MLSLPKSIVNMLGIYADHGGIPSHDSERYPACLLSTLMTDTSVLAIASHPALMAALSNGPSRRRRSPAWGTPPTETTNFNRPPRGRSTSIFVRLLHVC